jgi:cell wall assembly regulator SMI1
MTRGTGIQEPSVPPTAPLKELLLRLDTLLKELRPEYYAQLQPPASEEQLQQFERSIGFPIPEAFKELYRWKNGQPRHYFHSFIYNDSFLSLEEAQDAYNMLNELLESGDFDREHWWSPYWLPFLESAGGDLVCVDMEGTFTGLRGQILQFWHDDETRLIDAPNLEEWFASLVDHFEWAVEKGIQDEEELTSTWEQDIPDYPIRERAGKYLER